MSITGDVKKVSLGLVNEFKVFIAKGNVVDLAVGIIIGAAFGDIVKSMVKDVITPLIGIVGGKPDFSAFTRADYDRQLHQLNRQLSDPCRRGVLRSCKTDE